MTTKSCTGLDSFGDSPPHLGSLYPLFVEILALNHRDQTSIVLCNATACLFIHAGKTFLITNWHVLAGRNAENLTPLDRNLATPYKIRVHFPLEKSPGECIEEIYCLNDERGNAVWLEHELSNQIDVAALEIVPPAGIATFPVSDALPQIANLSDYFYVTQDVWVIGYPLGLRIKTMPIWKRATIAAEPAFSSAIHKHKIYLDTATREGMSGSPALFVSKNPSTVAFDNRTQPVLFPTQKVLLGIYSGRIPGEDQYSAQLAIVWSAAAILEIIIGGQKYDPNQPFGAGKVNAVKKPKA